MELPKGSHSGPVEHNHIEMVKRPSKRTQKRRSCLDMQLAQRNYESFLINTAYERMQSFVGNSRNPPCQRFNMHSQTIIAWLFKNQNEVQQETCLLRS